MRHKKFDDGVMVEFAVTKYWCKFDGEVAAKETKKLNVTRLFEELLKSKKCPADVKLELAQEMNNSAAKAYLSKVQAEQASPSPAVANEEAELQAKRKAAKTDGTAHAKEGERQELITKFVGNGTVLPACHACSRAEPCVAKP